MAIRLLSRILQFREMQQYLSLTPNILNRLIDAKRPRQSVARGVSPSCRRENPRKPIQCVCLAAPVADLFEDRQRIGETICRLFKLPMIELDMRLTAKHFALAE